MKQVNPWGSYHRVATQTAPPGELVLMLFDGAIRFLERALTGFDKDDPAEFNQTINNNVLRAQDIVRELNASLNLEAGGELAVHLRRVYRHVDWQLNQSNLRKDAAGIQDSLQRLTVLRDSWAAMLDAQLPNAKGNAPAVLTAA